MKHMPRNHKERTRFIKSQEKEMSFSIGENELIIVNATDIQNPNSKEDDKDINANRKASKKRLK